MQCVLVTFFAPTAPSPSTPTLSTLTSMSTQLLVFILFFLIQRLQFMLPNYFREGGLSTWGRILQRNTLFQQMSVVSSSSVRDSVLCISSPCWDLFFSWFELRQVLCILSYLLLVYVCDCPTVSGKYCALEPSLDLVIVLPLFLVEDFWAWSRRGEEEGFDS